MRIKMLQSDSYQGPKGILRFEKDKVYEGVDPKIISSLVGRGYAVVLPEGDESVPVDHVYDRDELARMTVAELRKLAAKANIPDYQLLRKPQLIDAICPPAVPGEVVQVPKDSLIQVEDNAS